MSSGFIGVPVTVRFDTMSIQVNDIHTSYRGSAMTVKTVLCRNLYDQEWRKVAVADEDRADPGKTTRRSGWVNCCIPCCAPRTTKTDGLRDYGSANRRPPQLRLSVTVHLFISKLLFQLMMLHFAIILLGRRCYRIGGLLPSLCLSVCLSAALCIVAKQCKIGL